MKHRNIAVLFVFSIILFSIGGCKKEENNPIDQPAFSAKGSDYLPPAAPKAITLKLSGTGTVYDSLGKMMEMKQLTNQIYNGVYEPAATISNITVNPLSSIDSKNKKSSAGFLYLNNGDVCYIPDDGYPKDAAPFVLLPNELHIGKEWIFTSGIKYYSSIKFKLTEALDSYTTSAGVTYKNVIKVNVSFKDSVIINDVSSSSSEYSYLRIITSGDLYLAKGAGYIEVKLNDYEKIFKSYKKNSGQNYSSYEKEIMSGMISFIF